MLVIIYSLYLIFYNRFLIYILLFKIYELYFDSKIKAITYYCISILNNSVFYNVMNCDFLDK